MSGQPDSVDLRLLMRLANELVSDVRALRDDMNVMAAILQRVDGTLAGLVNEIRATHSQLSRMDRRVRTLEAGVSGDAAPS